MLGKCRLSNPGKQLPEHRRLVAVGKEASPEKSRSGLRHLHHPCPLETVERAERTNLSAGAQLCRPRVRANHRRSSSVEGSRLCRCYVVSLGITSDYCEGLGSHLLCGLASGFLSPGCYLCTVEAVRCVVHLIAVLLYTLLYVAYSLYAFLLSNKIRPLALRVIFPCPQIFVSIEVSFGNAQVKVCQSENRSPKILAQVVERITNPSAKKIIVS